jgi:hypothetical protein
LCQHLTVNSTDERRAKVLAISQGVLLGSVLAAGAVAVTFLVIVALDVRNAAAALLLPAVVIIAIYTASIVYMYKRRGF